MIKKFREVFTLSTVTINVADGCNLNCSYCFEHDKKNTILKKEDACKILDIVYKDFDNNFPDLDYFMVNIFGGEPLLAWETIKAMVEHKKKNKYKMRFGITTNLTLLTDEMIEVIEDEEIFLLVSIDGIKEVHDKNRYNSFDTVVSNINKLKEREIEFLVEARMTILPEDAGHVYDGVKFLINNGIYNIAPVPVTDVNWTDENIAILRKDLDTIFSMYLNIANDPENKKNVSIKLINDYIEHILEPVLDEIEPCTAGTTKWVAIGTDGTLMPCHQRHTVKDHYEDLYIGNILKDEVDEEKIINPSYKNKDQNINHKCDTCSAISICRGGCPSENLTMTGNWYTPTKSWCKIQIMLYSFAKDFQDKILNAKNLRVRQLNLLKSNLQMKQTLESICDMDIREPEFKIKLTKFFNDMNDQKESILPLFKKYYSKKLAPIYIFANLDIKKVQQCRVE